MRFFNLPVVCLSSMAVACLMLPACSNGPSRQKSVEAKATGNQVVGMPAHPDVQSAPDKYVGQNVAWIGATGFQVTVDANGSEVQRDFVWRDKNRQLDIQNSFSVMVGGTKETEAAKASKGDLLVSGTIKEILRLAPLNGLVVRPAIVCRRQKRSQSRYW